MNQSKIYEEAVISNNSFSLIRYLEVTEDNQWVVIGTSIGLRVYKSQTFELVFRDDNEQLFVNGLDIVTPYFQNFIFFILLNQEGKCQSPLLYDAK